MPSKSRTSSPSQYSKEKPYDGSEQSSDEDFVNAAATPRPSSRTSAASGGSRSARKAAIVSESSEETDSEEERDLQDDLRDTAGIETGAVRGAPVESTSERIMRSVGKSSNSQRSSQQYASLADAEAGRSTGHHRKNSKKHSRQNRAHALAAANRNGDPGRGGMEVPENKKSKSKRIWCWVFGAIVALILVAAIIAAIVILVKRKSADSGDDKDSASNSTSLANHGNSSMSSNSTIAGNVSSNSTGLGHGSMSSTRIPNDGSWNGNASPVNTATYDDGKYRPATTAAAIHPGHSTLEDVEDQLATAGGLQSGAMTKGVDSADAAGQSLVSPPVPTQTQVYGSIPEQGRTQERPSGLETGQPAASASADTGSATPDDITSIQTVPNPQPSLATDSSRDQAGFSAPNAGQWNAPSNTASQGTQVQGDPAAQPTSGQAQTGATVKATPGQSQGGGDEGPLSQHFGVGPVVPSATGLEAGAAPTAAVIGGAYDSGQPANVEGSQPAGSWNAPEQQAQPISPVDSTTPGPFTAGEFKQATHPEPFQTYNSPGTWFESSGHYGACGLATNNTDFVVAINDALWLESTKGSASAQSPHCGAEVLLTSLKDGATVNAWVTERCAYCSTEGSGGIDLSKAAFSALAGGSTDAGTLDLVWGFTGDHSKPSPSSSTPGAASGKTPSDPTPTKPSSSSSWIDSLFGDSEDSATSDGAAASSTKASSESGMFGRRHVVL